MRKLLVCLLICCSGILLSRAQDKMAKSPSPDKWQIFGGYTFQRTNGMPNDFSDSASCEDADNCDYFAPFNSNGGQAAISYFPKRHLGLTFQMTFVGSGTRNIYEYVDPTQSISMQSYLFGPTYRYAIYGGKATLFYHVLVGISHNTFNASTADFGFCYDVATDSEILSCSSNNFTVATGGGVDVRLSRHISVRPAQLEYWTEQIPNKTINDFIYWPGQSLKQGVDGLRYSAGGVFNFYASFPALIAKRRPPRRTPFLLSCPSKWIQLDPLRSVPPHWPFTLH